MYNPGRWKLVVEREGERIHEEVITDFDDLETKRSLYEMNAVPGDVISTHCLEFDRDTVRRPLVAESRETMPGIY